jgi:hypothetical protein
MPRPSKKTELAPLDRPSLLPEDYADAGSAVIRYGQIAAARANKEVSALDVAQVKYLNMRMAGVGLAETCKALQIDAAVPMLWEEESGKDGLFSYCVAAIRRKQALLLEDSMWEQAIADSRSSRDTMRMHLLDSRMPEYKANAPTVTVPVQVNIKIDGQPFMVDVGEDGESAYEIEGQEDSSEHDS